MKKAPDPARAEDAASAKAPGNGPPEERLPCQSANRAAWKYALLAVIFLAWLAFLIYCAIGGNG